MVMTTIDDFSPGQKSALFGTLILGAAIIFFAFSSLSSEGVIGFQWFFIPAWVVIPISFVPFFSTWAYAYGFKKSGIAALVSLILLPVANILVLIGYFSGIDLLLLSFWGAAIAPYLILVHALKMRYQMSDRPPG